MYVLLFLNDFIVISTGGLFPTDSHEYDVFRFALSQHNDVPKLVPQVDMVDTGSSFAMTYACKFCICISQRSVTIPKTKHLQCARPVSITLVALLNFCTTLHMMN